MFHMILFGLMIILAVGGFGTAALALRDHLKSKNSATSRYSPSGARIGTILVGGGLAALGVLGIALSSFTIVPPRTVAVVVEFGRPVGTLANGLHAKAPWQTVEKLDGAVQLDTFGGNTGTNPIPARLGDDSIANVDATVQWQLRVDDAEQIFLDYRTFENIQQNLVQRNFVDAVNRVMANYDPLAPEDERGESAADMVANEMRSMVGDQIDIRSVTIPLINFSEVTQERINDLRAEEGRARTAEARQRTSEAEAEANRLLQEGVTTETLISKCLDIIAASGQSPIGCFPGNAPQAMKVVE